MAHGEFDPTPRDADVSERAIVELMELADDTAQEPFIGQVARQPSAPRAESAEPLRQPAHGAAHAGFDDETVETGLPLGLQEQGQGKESFLSNMVAPSGAGFSNKAEVQWCRTRMSSGMRPRLASCSSSSSLSHARMRCLPGSS